MEWRAISSLPEYEVSNTGLIRSPRKILDQTLSTTGYLYVTVSKKKLKVHRLVALAFIPNPENKKCINHKDGDKINNNDWNLEWSTHAENNDHALVMGLRIMPSGADHSNAKKIIDNSNGKIYTSIVEAANEISVNTNTLRSWLGGFRKNKSSLAFMDTKEVERLKLEKGIA